MNVEFFPDSPINEWDYGPFSGTVSREPERKAGWCNRSQSIVEHRPEHWSVTIGGINGAWRCVRLPLKKGRTMARAVIDACSQFSSPEDIRPSDQGWFGGVISLLS